MNDNYPTEAWWVYSFRFNQYIAASTEEGAYVTLHDLNGDGEIIKFSLGLPEIVPVKS